MGGETISHSNQRMGEQLTTAEDTLAKIDSGDFKPETYSDVDEALDSISKADIEVSGVTWEALAKDADAGMAKAMEFLDSLGEDVVNKLFNADINEAELMNMYL